MIIMSVDYGDARTGVAVSDKSEFMAIPVEVIRSGDENEIVKRLIELAVDYRAELFVVGLPKNMDGTEGERAQKCRRFALILESASSVKTMLYDERLTTVSAHRVLNSNDVRGRKRKNVVDAVAAVLILEDFMAFKKNSNGRL